MEFQPVILAAGKGSRLQDLTSGTIPKCLLPVANKPLLWYSITSLEKAGFTEAIVLVADSEHQQIVDAMQEQQDFQLKLDFFDIPDSEDWGTADSLRHLYQSQKIKTDILLISCDWISDIALHKVADLHRVNDSSFTALFAPIPDDLYSSPLPGPKTKTKPEREFIGFDSKNNRLVFVGSEADYDEFLPISKSLLRKHPQVKICSKLSDAHVYLIKRWLVEYLAAQKKLSMFKGEFMPHLIKLQNKQKKIKGSNHLFAKFLSVDANFKSLECVREFSSYGENYATSGDRLSCYGYVISKEADIVCLRTNTMATYCEANRQMLKKLPGYIGDSSVTLVHPEVVINGKSQIGSDCAINEGTTIGDKASVKKSIIGSHGKVGDRVKMTSSVVMGHVIIGEGCSIQNCIVLKNVVLGNNCDLKDCIVGSGQRIQDGTKATNEVIGDQEQLMEF